MKTLRLPFLLFFFLTLLPSAWADQALHLKIRWKAGTSHRIFWLTNQQIQQTVMGQTSQLEQAFGTGYLLKIKSVSPEGIATVDVVFERVSFRLKTPQAIVDYDSLKPTEKIPPFAIGFAAIVGRQFSMTMSDTGKPLAIQGVDKMFEGIISHMKDIPAASRGQVLQQLRQQFGDITLKNTMEQMMDIYPPGPVSIGASWSKESLIQTGAPMKMKRTWTLLSVTSNKAVLKTTAEIQPNLSGTPLQMGPMTMRHRLTGTQNGQLVISLETGLPYSGNLRQSISGTILVTTDGSQQMPKKMEWPISIRGSVRISPLH